MTTTTLKIATRKSPLALWQAEFVSAEIRSKFPDVNVDLLGMQTTADKLVGIPLNKIGGKGLFIKELEKAIMEKRADIAVHSIKDMPPGLPEGLALAAVCKRDDPRDAFVSNHFQNVYELPKNAIVGTSSLRRQSQLLALRPDLRVQFLRGNVNTRLSKLDEGEYDAIILAAVGLKRLHMTDRIRAYFTEEEMLPAAGQGAIGVEARLDDTLVMDIITPLNDSETQVCITAERALTQQLGGSCQVPIAAHARIVEGELVLKGLIAKPDGSVILKAQSKGSLEQASSLGEQVAEELKKLGALDIINNIIQI